MFFKILGTLRVVYKLCEVCEPRRVGVCGACVSCVFVFVVEYVCVFQDSRNAQGSIQAM